MKIKKKYKCGYVAGMFDIFHIGHLNLLKLSKELCEYLIVAVGTDDHYMRKKKRKTIMSYDERQEIIKAIRYVDKVVAVTDLNKLSEYEKYHFDVMFAGEDHKSEDVYIRATIELKELGVDTIYIGERKSSSTLLRKFIEKHGNAE